MKKKVLAVFLLAFAMMFAIPSTVYADMGPKPSVHVNVEGLNGKKYYATLLSRSASSGPWYAPENGMPDNPDMSEDEMLIWKKFADYSDTDGFYFLQRFWECEGNDEYVWGYYPPKTFKILLYFPDGDSFAVSEITETYAFASYYTITLAGRDISSVQPTPVEVKRSYDYTWEFISLILRIVLTLAIELLVALAFGFREKKQLLFILAVNVITQVLLNVILNVIAYFQGALVFMIAFFLMEGVILILETILYALCLKKFTHGKFRPWLAAIYAVTANLLSLGLGFVLAIYIPGLF